jgi:hypothetical protein
VAADRGYLSVYGVRGEVQQRIDSLTYAFVDLLSDAPRPESLRSSIAAAVERPLPTSFLLIAGGAVETERHALDFIRGSHSEAVQTWTVPGAGHVQALTVAPAEWETRVIAFLAGALADSAR